jgi:Protein of unknown function (DUF3617)
MPNPRRILASSTSLLLATLASAPCAFAQTASAAAPPLPRVTRAAELPAFLPGLWEYQRTVLTAANPKPQKSSIRKCSDPSSEIKQKITELQQKGCQFSPLLPRGNQYLSTWRCPVTSGALVDRNVVTVKSDSSYQDDNEVHAGEHVTRSTVVANRLGGCPAPGTNPTAAPRKP